MRNKALIRFQLTLLVVAVALITWRMSGGELLSERGSSFVNWKSLDDGRLYTEHFEVVANTRLKIEGVASFEDDRAASKLAVYPWIVNRTTNEVVWVASEGSVVRDGVKALIDDSVDVEVGNYSAYYTTYGPSRTSRSGGSFMGLKPHWTNYESFWGFEISAPTGTVSRLSHVESADRSSSTLWAYQPGRQGGRESVMIHVVEDAVVSIDATVALCDRRCDEVELTQLPHRDHRWSISDVETESAGGGDLNRSYSGSIELGQGVYEITYKVGGNGRSTSWTANPPLLPYEWGVNVSTETPAKVRTLDPWNGAEPLISLLEVGDSEMRIARLETDESLDIIVYSMGEMTSNTDLYDWAWIEREGESDKIWEMSYQRSNWAGGDDSNRKEMSLMRLEPGAYFIKYRTDGSHSFEGFGKRRPTNPDRWGVALFALNADGVAEGSVRTELVRSGMVAGDVATSNESVLTGIDSSRFIARRTSVENDVDFVQNFELTEESRVIVAALGEISSSTRYDYGWIESLEKDATVWEMTYQETTAAGGDDSYRSVYTELTLPAGSYRVHFHTDSGIAYDSFGSSEPDHPEDWGIAIFWPER